ncbi:MAG TPA: HAMP domain-containing sensor histidine kinase [Cyclobacteriaceae bacterium]|nr:HAMP domain-containing sensor histidine kinase [Cyclobacteriaceae bacterium]
MLIRHKIILWFIGLTGLLLCLFSFYIYFAFANSRRQVFQERIRNKAVATKEIYDQHDKVAERIITSIPEQSEYVFDEHYQIVFAINDLHDFDFNRQFLELVTKSKELYFDYTKAGQKKEGFAFSFGPSLQARIIAITAVDKAGFEQVRNLGLILIFGNLFFLILIGVAGYLFARNVLRPVNELVLQVESVQADNLGYRLTYRNPSDEIGIVTLSFNKALERIQSLVDSQKAFISYASHELRTPLAAISGILETSMNYDSELSLVKKSIEAAHKESQRAAGLVNGLLQLAKIESTAGAMEMQNLNIVDLLIDTISFFKLKNPLQEFSLNIAQKLPKNSYIELLGNDHLLRTAFFNIIDNASKYSSFEKIEIAMTIVSNAGILIRVVDSGIGIEADDMKHIHAPLFRGRNTSGIEGFGLGLALTYRIIALHKGEVVIKRNSGSGTTVELFLPASISESV